MFNKLNFHLQNKLSDCNNFSRVHLSSTKKRYLKQRAVILNKRFKDSNNSLYTRCYLMMLENIDFKVLKSVPLGKKKTPKNI